MSDCRCAECQSPARVLRSHTNRDGTRTRRYECHGCQRRWTIWDEGRKRMRPEQCGRPVLSDDQLLELLTTRREVPAKRLAAEWGCSPFPILQARKGLAYTNRLPDIPRPGLAPAAIDCRRCIHWEDDACLLGFPEPQEEGPGFAADCAAFVEPA